MRQIAVDLSDKLRSIATKDASFRVEPDRTRHVADKDPRIGGGFVDLGGFIIANRRRVSERTRNRERFTLRREVVCFRGTSSVFAVFENFLTQKMAILGTSVVAKRSGSKIPIIPVCVVADHRGEKPNLSDFVTNLSAITTRMGVAGMGSNSSDVQIIKIGLKITTQNPEPRNRPKIIGLSFESAEKERSETSIKGNFNASKEVSNSPKDNFRD